ncbi:MAG: type II toxin-antitoxin system VapC family toxin [Chloroflexi bacterium]|nr:type II toxin-antitoxin system VapC family toxin [Chloroflexota bacterium]
MSYLLDTSAFLWFVTGDRKLSTLARRVLEESSDDFYLSLASIWELAIKSNLGRGLELPRPFVEFVDIELQAERIQILNIELSHLKQVADLPYHHRDPFDRLLIAQSQVENIPVLTSDVAFDSYEIQRLW